MTEVQVSSINRVTGTNTEGEESSLFSVTFGTHREDKILEIVWGEFEALQAASTLEEKKAPRPQTYDLTASLLEAFGSQLTSAEISRVAESVYYAVLHIEWDGRRIDLDCRPSDAVNLALRKGCPIHISSEISALPKEDRILGFGAYQKHGFRVMREEPIWPASQDQTTTDS